MVRWLMALWRYRHLLAVALGIIAVIALILMIQFGHDNPGVQRFLLGLAVLAAAIGLAIGFWRWFRPRWFPVTLTVAIIIGVLVFLDTPLIQGLIAWVFLGLVVFTILRPRKLKL